MIGYTISEISPIDINKCKSFIHPEDIERVEKQLENYFEQKSDAYECEMRIRHKNGKWLWVLDRGRVVKWARNGKALRMSGTHQDISSRKEVEQALQESQSRLSEIFDSVNDAIIIHDPETCAVVDVNRRMCEMYGFTRDDVIKRGMFWQNSRPPFSAKEGSRKISRGTERMVRKHLNGWLTAKMARDSGWEINMRPANIGKQRRIICVSRDITERRKYEEKLRLAASVFARSYEGIMVDRCQ